MTDVLEPTVGRPSRARRFSRRSKAIAASLSLLAAGIGGTLVSGTAPAQAADPAYDIAVVIPWNRIPDVHSFRVQYTYGGTLAPKVHGLTYVTSCFTDVQFTDAMNYWSTPYTLDFYDRALNPAVIPITVQYFNSTDCSTDEIATVSYVGDELYFGKKYVYTYKGF